VKLLVVGAAGMLGRDLVDAAEAAGHEVTGLTHADVDISNGAATQYAIEPEKPDVVINCAAWTDVDGAEAEEAAATKVNGMGAGFVARAAARAGAAVIYPSTDYVFDGSKTEPYLEDDETGPLSAYGRSKLAGELATAKANDRHFIARTSWVFGQHGKNFVKTMLALSQERDEIGVVDDQVGCPTYTGHLAAGLLALAERDDHGVHHLAGSGECSWYQFAMEIFSQTGAECTVNPITTDQMPRPATRPAYGVLGHSREGAIELPAWQDGLREYLA
jgi:dTDP-4-dehydrorhamnose reductase